MNALAAYATRHGATAGIAERIAESLTSSGVPAEAIPVDEVGGEVAAADRRRP